LIGKQDYILTTKMLKTAGTLQNSKCNRIIDVGVVVVVVGKRLFISASVFFINLCFALDS